MHVIISIGDGPDGHELAAVYRVQNAKLGPSEIARSLRRISLPLVHSIDDALLTVLELGDRAARMPIWYSR